MVDPKFDLETLLVMAQSGCGSLTIGVETVIDRVLKLVKKRATLKDTLLFFENCKKAKIKLHINLIPNLPTTTKDEAMAALKILKETQEDDWNYSILPFEATRSSEIGRNPDSFGLKVVERRDINSEQAQFNANHLDVVDSAMQSNELQEVLHEYRRLTE